ncbi:MAG TPA: penicillin acylase family protein, partial [Chitinophaga sp.]|uniref:penicillin acylase family protein n=1 Tax=Chitinophaga sp. TaxID=1869181 RepID=UPI002CF84C44
MKKIHTQAFYPLIALVILVFTLSESMFNVPPLGKLLNPFTGIVQNNRDRGLNTPQLTLRKMGLTDTVSIFFDQRKVPHIYATNNTDLYFAQGYVTAVLRLWQMDFMSHAVAGRMSEIFPGGYLEYDRNQRRIGMLEAAKASLSAIENDPETLRTLTAYTQGVNAYISQLDYKEIPLEYKLMDYRPEKWTNLKSVLLMKYMAGTLSGYEEDFSMSWMMLALGEERFNKFYPDFTSRISPMDGSTPAVAPTTTAYIHQPAYLRFSFFASKSVLPQNTYNPKLGSNSWVVSGKKTSSGHPILCADPHLNLSLPAIWLEMQLSSPDMNVYGVSIPGTPAVIIGFNEHIAWGLTNGADDAKDWYRLKVSNDYKKYEMDGQWKELTYMVDTIKRKGQTDFYDTVYHTVHGPVPYTKDFSFGRPELLNSALRWELHKPSNEFLTFIQLNRAKNYSEYRTAISHYASPVQNFTFACKDNTIAVNHQGRLPVKNAGQGKFVQDGTQSVQLYTQYIPNDSLPAVLNPACNYVVSANQHPTDASYHWYYNGYFSENRAN